jgi:hypothetical protein
MSIPIEIKRKKDNPLSASMVLNDNSNLSNTPTNKIYEWIPDNMSEQCSMCKSPFTFYLRKHHCRCCGRIFCYKCSNYTIIIPEDFSYLHKKTQETIASRVCKACHDNIIQFNDTNKLMKIFSLLNIDIEILNDMRPVCKTWKNYADFRLNKFREIQYCMPNHKFTHLEKQLLWTNHYHVINHPRNLVQLLKSLDFNDYKIRENKLKTILDMINNKSGNLTENKIVSCHKMRCTRNCKKYDSMTCEDALNLLNENITSTEIRKLAISCFDRINYSELICYLPFLIFCMRYESIENSVIGEFIINICMKPNIDQLTLCSEVFWEFNVQLDQVNLDKTFKTIYNYFLDSLLDQIPVSIRTKLVESKKLVGFLNNFKNESNREVITMGLSQIDPRKTVIPLKPELECKSIDMNGIHVKTSYSMPLILPFICTNNKKDFNYNVLFKFEDIRKDQLVLNLIKIISKIINQEENLELDIVTYKTRPTGANHGFIEIVPNSHTIRFIKEQMKFSILNFIMEHNRDKTVNSVRQQFLKSCAIYCVITYIFGIGDRHLDNIMLTENGALFHIDYSYIMGYDPKPLTDTTMRIPNDMIDALGGQKSDDYLKFKEICNRMYSCVRRHVNLFVNMITTLNKTNPPLIASEEHIYDELIRRLIPGENCKQAEIQLYSVIDNSTTDYKYNVIDWFHFYDKTYISSMMTSSVSYMRSFFY